MTQLAQAEVFLLDKSQCEHYWKDISASLDEEPELWNKWFTKAGILGKILDESMQAWVICEKDGPIQAIFLTQMLVSELGKVLQVFWLRGELPEGALKCISLTLDTFGSHHGCYRLYVVGRRGWERRLEGLGAEFESITLSRPIRNVTRN